jgi:dihydrofolate reductase
VIERNTSLGRGNIPSSDEMIVVLSQNHFLLSAVLGHLYTSTITQPRESTIKGMRMTTQSFDPLRTSLKGCVNMALSVDGFIAGKDGDMDWLNNQPQVEGDGDMGFADFLAEMDVMIMGRKTFDTVVGFGKDIWPYADLPILVWTSNVDNVHVPDWILEKKSVMARSAASPKALWEELESSGKYTNAYIDGGKTIQSFLQAGLIHDLTLTRVPILLGEGTPLFSGMDHIVRKLKHVSTKSHANGMVTSSYTVVFD